MTKRLDDAMTRMRESGRTGVIPYVTIGFPTLDDTMEIVPALERAGAAAIELGVPYSDPLGEGPTIQSASHRALEGGMDTYKCVAAAKQLREAGVTVPLIFMGYYNPVVSYGLEKYAKDCADAGVDGFIVVDLPMEEATPFHDAVRKHQLALVPLVAPTSTDRRIALGTKAGDGFVYCVSVAGVTGARHALPPGLPDFVGRVRAMTDLPIAVGFGVSERAHVEAIGKYADAAAVGSALIDVIDSAPPGERASRAEAFVSSLVGKGA